jgi:toxin ParE1/3/4
MSELNYDSRFHPEARFELLGAIEYYRTKSVELARDFYEEVNQSIEELLEFPESSLVIHPVGVRRKVLRRFPYNLLYTADPDELYIVAVAHQKRRPEYWLTRGELKQRSLGSSIATLITKFIVSP